MDDIALGTTGLALHNEKFFGNYRAKVEDNVDPLQLGRIRARAYPMFSTVNATLLPWAVPAMPLFEGAGVGIGAFCVPDIGANVWVFFEQGDHNQPVYFAEAQDTVKGLPTARITNYPNRKVFRTSSGVEIIIDDNVSISTENGNIVLNPDTLHRTIINALAMTIKTYSSDHLLDGDDGGLVLVDGAITLTLPSAAVYPGMIYVFKRIDAGAGAAIIVGQIEDTTQIELVGKWDGIVLESDGVRWIIPAVTAPIGSITMWGGAIASPPPGWLICDGSSISQTIYVALYSVIGSTYNTGGEGAGNFRLPNFTNRFPYGANEGVSAGNASVGSAKDRVLSGNDSSVILDSGDNNKEDGGGACTGPHTDMMPPYLAVAFIIKV